MDLQTTKKNVEALEKFVNSVNARFIVKLLKVKKSSADEDEVKYWRNAVAGCMPSLKDYSLEDLDKLFGDEK